MCQIWLFPIGVKRKVILRDYKHILVTQIQNSEVILGAVWQQLLHWRHGFLVGNSIISHKYVWYWTQMKGIGMGNTGKCDG